MAQEQALVGDAQAGKKLFRKCTACHLVMNEAGEKLAGRNGRTGPNLYALHGRVLAGAENYRYGKSIKKAGEDVGLVWDQENFIAYTQDPTRYLKQVLNDPKARSKMSFRLRRPQEAADIYEFLRSLGSSPE